MNVCYFKMNKVKVSFILKQSCTSSVGTVVPSKSLSYLHLAFSEEKNCSWLRCLQYGLLLDCSLSLAKLSLRIVTKCERWRKSGSE